MTYTASGNVGMVPRYLPAHMYVHVHMPTYVCISKHSAFVLVGVQPLASPQLCTQCKWACTLCMCIHAHVLVAEALALGLATVCMLHALMC